MQPTVEFKRIIITDARQIIPMGGITGPVNTPIIQPTRIILEMLQHGLNVVEVAENGEQQVLDFSNYNLLFEAVETVAEEQETPVNETLVPESGTTEPEQVPVEETPTEEAAPVEPVVEETPVEETPAEEAAPVEAPVEPTPAEPVAPKATTNKKNNR